MTRLSLLVLVQLASVGIAVAVPHKPVIYNPPPQPPLAPGVLNCTTPGVGGLFLTPDKIIFNDAEVACNQIGGSLVDITNRNFLIATALLSHCIDPSDNAWIGTWDGGRQINGETSPTEECLTLFAGSNGRGGGIRPSCSGVRYAICHVGKKHDTNNPETFTDNVNENDGDSLYGNGNDNSFPYDPYPYNPYNPYPYYHNERPNHHNGYPGYHGGNPGYHGGNPDFNSGNPDYYNGGNPDHYNGGNPDHYNGGNPDPYNGGILDNHNGGYPYPPEHNCEATLTSINLPDPTSKYSSGGETVFVTITAWTGLAPTITLMKDYTVTVTKVVENVCPVLTGCEVSQTTHGHTSLPTLTAKGACGSFTTSVGSAGSTISSVAGGSDSIISSVASGSGNIISSVAGGSGNFISSVAGGAGNMISSVAGGSGNIISGIFSGSGRAVSNTVSNHINTTTAHLYPRHQSNAIRRAFASAPAAVRA